MEISVTAITNLHQIHFTALENNGGLRFPPCTDSTAALALKKAHQFDCCF
jgi:hypothetical protein